MTGKISCFIPWICIVCAIISRL